MDTKNLILSRLSSLSPTLQEAARFIADHPDEVVISSMRALAEQAGAHPATFVRLARQLGYAGWAELKAAFAEDLGLYAGRYAQRAKSLTSRSGDIALLNEIFATQRDNLELTEAACTNALHEAVKLLRAAENVYVAGFRASIPIAYCLVYGYRLFRDSVSLIDGHSIGLEMQLRPLRSKDIMVAISFAPYSKESMEVIHIAHAAGARVIAITDSRASPLAQAADATILFSGSSPSFFPSVAAAIAVTEALLELLVADSSGLAAQQIHRTEQQLYESGAYLQAPAKRPGKRPNKP